jgi:hypothetical protein
MNPLEKAEQKHDPNQTQTAYRINEALNMNTLNYLDVKQTTPNFAQLIDKVAVLSPLQKC